MSYGDYEPVIGLEVHAQLLTETKTFCGCRTSFGDPPNAHTCPVCLGLPGALPVLNRKAVELAVRASLALECTINASSVFSRKNYFYPDLPKGYQISQYDQPLASHGLLAVTVLAVDGAKASDSFDAEPAATTKNARILRVHMEEDAGKNLHDAGTSSVVDLNRAGTPLIEIVGEPDLRSPAEASDYLRRLRDILMFVEVCDGNLEQGSFRADANVSIRKKGDETLGTRVELKNINSFRFVEEAIDIEIKRQIDELAGGRRVRQQTRGYNSERRETYLLRDKENDAGYRYFPEPDLRPLRIRSSEVEAARGALAELPAARRQRYTDALGLSPYAASVLTAHPAIARFFDATVSLGATPLRAANFIQAEMLGDVVQRGLHAAFPVTPEQTAGLLALVEKNAISGKQAKDVYQKLKGTSSTAADVVAASGMAVIADAGALEEKARAIIASNPKPVAQYRAGKTALLGFFVGQIMKDTKGSADPQIVNDIFKRLLSETE